MTGALAQNRTVKDRIGLISKIGHFGSLASELLSKEVSGSRGNLMKLYLTKSLNLVLFCLGVQLSFSIAFGSEEFKNRIPEAGPIIEMKAAENIAELGRSCDLDHLQNEEISAAGNTSTAKGWKYLKSNESGNACQKLLAADRKFQVELNQTKCEALERYIPTEREIKGCQHKLRKNIGIGVTQIQKFQEDIGNRDECIVKIQSKFCERSANINSLEE